MSSPAEVPGLSSVSRALVLSYRVLLFCKPAHSSLLSLGIQRTFVWPVILATVSFTDHEYVPKFASLQMSQTPDLLRTPRSLFSELSRILSVP